MAALNPSLTVPRAGIGEGSEGDLVQVLAKSRTKEPRTEERPNSWTL